MSAEEPQAAGGSKWPLAIIVIVFAVPLLLAAWMYYGGVMVPRSATNHGALLQPITSLTEALPASPLHDAAPDQWLMLYMNTGDCGEQCDTALYRLRQTRLMLGNDMSRVSRIFLHGESAPDTVLLGEQYPGLITLQDKALAGLLRDKRPVDLPAGGSFLIDPLGNLVMYFSPELDPADVVDDVEHLLKLSHIG